MSIQSEITLITDGKESLRQALISKFGVIAQELQANGLSELVSEDSEGMLSVDYISLLCLKCAQLQKQIDELQIKLNKYVNNNL